LGIRWFDGLRAAAEAPKSISFLELRGPYTLWHHTHTFEERDGGTLCLDHVRYRPRGGALINWLFVRRDVDRIFQYRQPRMQELPGPKADETVQPASSR
jgi:ligand-binding SRPBCC domain-containing protein